MKTLEEYVKSIPDFPEKGIIFRDGTSVLQDADGLHLAIDTMQEKIKDQMCIRDSCARHQGKVIMCFWDKEEVKLVDTGESVRSFFIRAKAGACLLYTSLSSVPRSCSAVIMPMYSPIPEHRRIWQCSLLY